PPRERRRATARGRGGVALGGGRDEERAVGGCRQAGDRERRMRRGASGRRPPSGGRQRATDEEVPVAKLRHLAIATDDPDATAQFYVDVLGLSRVRTAQGAAHYGHILTDGTINLAILRFTTDEAAGVEKGRSFV